MYALASRGCTLQQRPAARSHVGASRGKTSRVVVVRAGKGKAPAPAQPPVDSAATTAPDWVQAPQGTLYTAPEAAQQPQAYAAVPQYPVAPPPPPPPAPVAAPSAGFPWYVWVGVGIFAANIGAKFANPQKVQEMAMQQMMKQMMSQAGMKPPAGGASPFGFPPGGFPPPPGGAGAANPFAGMPGMPMGGFPGMGAQPTVDVTGTASTVTTSSTTTTTTSAPTASTTPPPTSSTPPKADSTPAAAPSNTFFADVETEDTAATTAPGANFFEQQAAAAAAAAGQAQQGSSEDPAAAEERANAMLASMEVMLQDPKMQEMMYPYLPEPMRNPETFNFVLKDPTMRKQLVSTLAQSNISFDPTQMQAVMNNYNASSPEMEQMQQMGINPAEMMQEMMKDPEMLTLMQQPKIQKAIMEITANPMAMMNYQTDPDVMKVMMKVNNLMMPKIAEAQQNSATQQPVQQ